MPAPGKPTIVMEYNLPRCKAVQMPHVGQSKDSQKRRSNSLEKGKFGGELDLDEGAR